MYNTMDCPASNMDAEAEGGLPLLGKLERVPPRAVRYAEFMNGGDWSLLQVGSNLP